MKQTIIVESRVRAWTKVEPRPKTRDKSEKWKLSRARNENWKTLARSKRRMKNEK
jgi:hypothetical protein